MIKNQPYEIIFKNCYAQFYDILVAIDKKLEIHFYKPQKIKHSTCN